MGRHESEEVSIWALTSFRAQQELRLTLRSVSECDVRAAGEAVADSLAFGTWNIGTTFWLKLSQRFLLLRSCSPGRSPNKEGAFARESRPARMAADATGLSHGAIRVPGK